MSNTVVNLQDSRAVFQIFIALVRFSFDSPSYLVSAKILDVGLNTLLNLGGWLLADAQAVSVQRLVQ